MLLREEMEKSKQTEREWRITKYVERLIRGEQKNRDAQNERDVKIRPQST